MEIDSGTDHKEFQSQVRRWIGEHAPKGLAQMTDWSRLLAGKWWSYQEEMKTDEYKQWDKLMTQERLVCGHWPFRYGGRDLTTGQSAIIDQECLRANVPYVFREQGEAWVGSAILQHGTEEQKDYFLPRIVDGTDRYCQGFSEPDHGSDLAALETKGVIEGDFIYITGQKIWTTAGTHANRVFVLCRTDPDKSLRHRGISFVIVDVEENADTLEFRPIKQLTGESEFCETFLDGAKAPLDYIIGGVNNGWKVAMTTLDNERVGRAAAARNSVFAKNFRELVQVAQERGRTGDPEIRRQMVDLYSTLQALHQWAVPGAKGVHGSVEKLVSSVWSQQFGALAMAVLGESAGIRPEGPGIESTGGDFHLNRWQLAYFQSLSSTIASGSSEIQRNVVAERVLELPREARG